MHNYVVNCHVCVYINFRELAYINNSMMMQEFKAILHASLHSLKASVYYKESHTSHEQHA